MTALIATFIFGLGTMAGTLAIFLFTVAYVGKLTYEQIESLDMSTFYALESMGLTRLQAFRYLCTTRNSTDVLVDVSV